MSEKTVLGIDVGISSVAAGLIDFQKQVILCRAVRCFDSAEMPKDGGSIAALRRGFRNTRRRIRRQKHRIRRFSYYLVSNNICTYEEIQFLKTVNTPDIWTLRYSGLSEKISPIDWFRLLFYFLKHRGLNIVRKSELPGTHKEERKPEGGEDKKAADEAMKQVSSALQIHNDLIHNGYRTVGEYFYRESRFKDRKRNSNGDYSHSVNRSDVRKEIECLFTVQRNLDLKEASREIEHAFLDIFDSQRHFSDGPGTPSPYKHENMIENMIGKCSFEPDEYRAPKSGYYFERFRMFDDLSKIKLEIESDGTIVHRSLAVEEIQKICNLAYRQKSITYSSIKKELFSDRNGFVGFSSLQYSLSDWDIKKAFPDLTDGDKRQGILTILNDRCMENEEKLKRLCELADNSNRDVFQKLLKQSNPESKTIVSLKGYHALRQALEHLPEEWKRISEEPEILEKLAYILTVNKTDEQIKEAVQSLSAESGITFSDDCIDAIQKVPPFSQFGKLSVKALKKILPFMENGRLYWDACSEAYGSHTDVSAKTLDDITNPVVKRSVIQAVKMVKAVIAAYGKPDEIRIELARDLNKSFDERDQINKKQTQNEKERKEIIDELISAGLDESSAKRGVLKYRLWKEQKNYSPYSNRYIERGRLFEPGYVEIDHIIPYSKSFDDSYQNKVLVFASENQEKQNSLPFEYIASGDENSQKWKDFCVWVRSYPQAKKNRLLKTAWTEEDAKAYKARNLNDDRYVGTFLVSYLRNQFGEDIKIETTSGNITAVLRKNWGLQNLKYNENGERENDRNHALDALMCACTTSSIIQPVETFSKNRELYFNGQLSGRLEKRLDLPWQWFREEVTALISPEFDTDEKIRQKLASIPNASEKYDITDVKPLFVSRKPERKWTGALHDATIRSKKLYEKTINGKKGQTYSRINIQALTLTDLEKLAGRYDNGRETDYYEALKARLEESDGNGKKAFSSDDPFYKTREALRNKGRLPEGSVTNVQPVKNVKVFKVMNAGFDICKGFAGNGDMVRVDVFYQNKKYLLVPIYTHQIQGIHTHSLPCSAIVPGKPEISEPVNEENYIFSLYKNDLIMVEQKKKTLLGYYISTHSSSGGMTIITHDKSEEFEGVGVKTALKITKFEVDMLGNYHEIHRKEHRYPFTYEDTK